MADDQDNDTPVEVLCTVLPGEHAKGKQRFSIVATPYVAPEDSTRENWSLKLKTDVPLANLPMVLSTNVDVPKKDQGRFVLFLHTGDPKTVHKIELGYDEALNRRRLRKMKELWSKAFDYSAECGNGRSGFQVFHDVLSDPQDKKFNNGEKVSTVGLLPDEERTQTFDVTWLSQLFLAQRRDLLIMAFLARTLPENGRDTFFKLASTSLTDEGKNNLAWLVSEMRNRPFSSDYLAAKWLGDIRDIFLSEGTDSASGKLAALGDPKVDQLLQQVRCEEEELNLRVAKLGRMFAQKSVNPQEAEGLFKEIETTLRLRNQRIRASGLDFANLIVDLLPADSLSSETRKARKVAVERFQQQVMCYRDAVSFERPEHSADEPYPSSLNTVTDQQLRDGVRRKIMALRSHPTLSKCLRLIHDFEVDLGGVNIDKITHVSAAFLPADYSLAKLHNDPKVWEKITKTAVLIDSRGNLAPRPRAKRWSTGGTSNSFRVSHQIDPKFGLLGFNDPERFHLNILDTSQAIQAMQSSAQAIIEKSQTGALPQYTSFELPQLKSRGIELLDDGITMEATFDIALARIRHFASTTGADNVLYAEDLQTGTRIDILRHRHSDDELPAKAIYSPAHARRVFYPQINEIFGRSPNKYFHPFEEFSHRDEGYAGQLVREKVKHGKDKDDNPIVKRNHITSPRLMFWVGEPLGIPKDKTEIVDGRLDLPIDIKYLEPANPTNPKDPPILLPALREKDGYRVVGRPRYMNGDGPRFLFGQTRGKGYKDAKDIYLDYAGPDKNSPSFKFTPPDVIGAPQTIFLENDPLLSDRPSGPVLPDKLQTVVLRSYHDPNRPADVPRRVIVPPLTSFEQAEQQGQFDEDETPIPRGDRYMEDVEWDDVAMAFPVKDASYEIDNGEVKLKKKWDKQDKVEKEWDKQDKGPIFRGVLNRIYKGKPNYYFKDQRARRLGLALENNGRRELSPSGQASLVNETSNARLDPVMLSFFPENDLGYGNWINDGLSPVRIETRGRRKLKLDHLAVHLVPGAELELNLFCPPTVEEAIEQNLFVANLQNEVSRHLTELSHYENILTLFSKAKGEGLMQMKVDEELATFWQTAAMDVPSTLLNSVEKISVIHAVQKPLLVPHIPYKTIWSRPKPDKPVQQTNLRAFRIVRREEGPDDWNRLIMTAPASGPEAYRYAWFYGINSARETAPPEEMLTDNPDSTIGYFIGEVALDRETTGSLKCEMLFRDVQAEAAVVRKDRKNGPWQFDPRIQTRELFTITGIVKEYETNPDHIDLAFDDQGKPRALSYDFGTKARRIALRLIGTSRFAEFFAENLGEDKDGVTPKLVETELAFSDQENASHVDLSAALKRYNCPRLDHETVLFEEEFWIKSTQRPPRPDIREIKYRFRERILARDADSIVYERSCGLRLRLGDHHASGEGEMVALVLWPPGLVSDYPESCPADGDVVEMEHKLSPCERIYSSELRDWTMATPPVTTPWSEPDELPYRYESELGRSVTAWGTDPTTSSGFLDPVILPSQFAGYSMKKSNLKMPLSAEETELYLHDVAVIGFDPKLNKDGDPYWYIDIDVDATRTDSPFLRCALARCQMQSLPGMNLELSQPTVLDPLQLPPKRQVEIQMTKEGRIDISVTGAGYTRRSPAFIVRPNGDVLDHYTDTPLQNFKLMRRVGPPGSESFVQMYDEDGAELSLLQVNPHEQDTVLNWIAHFDLPRGITREDVRLSVFESEMNVPDIDKDPLADSQNDLVETIRPFACDIFLAEQRISKTPAAKPRTKGK